MKGLAILLAAAAALWGGGTGLAGQELAGREWTLRECMDYALEHSLTVRQSENALSQKEVELNTARSAHLPQIYASASENLSFGRGLTADNTYSNTNTTSSSFSLGGQLSLFQGFRVRNNVILGEVSLKSAAADLEKARDDIRVGVAQAYAQVLYNYEILEVAKSQITIDSLQVVRLEDMRRNGKASGAEVSAQQATLAQSYLTLTQAEGNLATAVLELTQLLELPDPEGFAIVRPQAGSLEPKPLLKPEEIYADAVRIRPAVASQELMLDYMDANIAVAKGAFLPTLSLSGGLGTNYYTSSGRSNDGFYNQLSNNFSQYVGLSMNIPIFSQFSTRNQLKLAKLNRSAQELRIESTKKSLYKEIQQAYLNAVNAQEKLRSSEAAKRSAEDAFALMKAKYENGKAGVTEFNESKTRLLSAGSDLVKARYEYLLTSRLLDFYRGEEIVF
ncbi:MAG: TolC family protein [Bacteroidia bacterium]|nr:TolC family protein [Bacteroidia bacterium]